MTIKDEAVNAMGKVCIRSAASRIAGAGTVDVGLAAIGECIWLDDIPVTGKPGVNALKSKSVPPRGNRVKSKFYLPLPSLALQFC